MRVKHYIKNFLVYIPLVFSGQFLSADLVATSAGFLAFCFLASSIYIFNDLNDIEKDRLHPGKKYRPLASGAVSKKAGSAVGAVCLAISILLQSTLGEAEGVWYLGTYFLLNVLYSRKLKDIPLLDIVVLVSGFLIRVLYGAALTGIEISGWLYLTVTAVSFYMGLGKRRNEWKRMKPEETTRTVLKGYTYEFLDKNMNICLGLAITFYALWAKDYGSPWMLWSVPAVMVLAMKYSMDIEGDSDGDPVEVIMKDRLLLVLALIYVVYIFAVIYIL